MILQEKKFVPVLCYVDDNWMDISGNVYPEDGIVYAKEFTDDINIEYGLYGIFWGNADFLIYEKLNGNWIIVKVEIDNDFIVVDGTGNRIKFKNGMIICSGDACKMGNYLWRNRNNSSQYSCYITKDTKKEDIVGTNSWVRKHKRGVSRIS